MSDHPIVAGQSQADDRALVGYDAVQLPALIVNAGPRAQRRIVEFFTATIRNPHTRRAYARTVREFCRWCEGSGLHLHQVNPVVVAAYVEHLGRQLAPPSVKQALAALKMLFDYLVLGHALETNPASPVRGPKWVVKKGSTPVLTPEETRQLFGAIDTSTIVGLRNRALIGVMVFSFARIGVVLRMNVEDFFVNGRRCWFRLHEKNSKRHEVPCHHKAEEYLHAYLDAAGIVGEKGTPLFRTVDRWRCLTSTRLDPNDALRMVKRCARAVGLSDRIGCHTSRATGITAYLSAGGTIERAAHIAAHESTRTTQLYNRCDHQVSLDEIERIQI